MLNNYQQALTILESYKPQIEQFKAVSGYTDLDFEEWRDEERTYLQDRQTEPAEDVITADYVEALQNLEKLQ